MSMIEKMDESTRVFFEREIEHVKSQTFDVQYPTLKALQLLPMNDSAGPGADSITYEQFDKVGMAKIIADYADDLPRVDIKGKKFTTPVESLGDAYGYSLQEVRSAALAGRALQTMRADSARRAMAQEEHRILMFGDSTTGLPGFLSNANVPSVAVPADGAGGATTFASKSADQILRDMNSLVNGIVDLTNGVEMPNTLLLPISQHSLIASTPRSATSDTTILQYFLNNNPFITAVEWVHDLKAPAAGWLAQHGITLPIDTGDVMVAYDRNPNKLTAEVPQPFEQLPIQERGLEFLVNCHQRVGGCIIYYPLSVSIAVGI